MLNHSLVPVGSTGYDIPYSARFNDALLSRTTGTHTNRNKMTISAWFKRSTTNDGLHLWRVVSGSNENMLRITGDQLLIGNYQGGYQFLVRTNRLFRDSSAWYHILISIDTTQATASDRVKMYINGELETSLQTATYPSLNFNIYCTQTGLPETIADDHYGNFTNGYFADFYRIDGQALTPSDFGETDEDYGHWKPIKYTGTYGSDGYYLDFKNSGSLGNDANGSNNWTPTNLAATDQMLDSPTNNFATLNPLNPNGSFTYSEGNTKVAVYDYGMFGTQSMLTGKWYWENLPNSTSQMFGVVHEDSLSNTLKNTASGGLSTYGGTNKGRAYYGDGNKKDASTDAAYGATFTSGDIIGVAYDADIGSITFYKNGVSQGVAFSSLPSGEWLPLTHSFSSSAHYVNFGQDSSFAGNKTAQGNADDNGYGDFYYAPPTGYLALCTQNLPEPTVVPSEHFNTVLYTGTGSTQSITGVGFQTDLVVTKRRDAISNHVYLDVLRGTSNALFSNTTWAEETNYTHTLDSDGFTLGSEGDFNTNGGSYVAWNWKANGAGVSNTNGTITSTVSANVDAGFSIVSYTGTGSAATVGHGLSSAPEMVIIKHRQKTGQWQTYHHSINSPNAEDYFLMLNSTNAAATDGSASRWNNTDPSSTVVTLGNDWEVNDNGQNFIMYAFHSVDGYSKVGSYTGNGSADGTFVHCGFRPAYVMVKPTSRTGRWRIKDAVRDVDNVMDKRLAAEGSDAEATGTTEYLDFTSNGFKIRTAEGQWNGNGETNIFIAFAENPFKYTNAR